MVEGSCTPVDPIEELRRTAARRRQKRRSLRIATVIGCALGLLASSLLWKLPVLAVWNASASAPPGLYRVEPQATIRRGDMVVAWMPGAARALAARRLYLPARDLLVKRVAALAGDEVCAAGSVISINGRPAAQRRRSDDAGQILPWWNGCRRLGERNYFLLANSPRSFDGRYFGISKEADIIGKAVLLWPR
jgi:conjugative transfer signal peptidase TraF